MNMPRYVFMWRSGTCLPPPLPVLPTWLRHYAVAMLVPLLARPCAYGEHAALERHFSMIHRLPPLFIVRATVNHLHEHHKT